jgi:hypothetical protein
MVLAEYKNGNANIKLHEDGTRVIEYDGELKLEFPLNIDIKVNSQCSFGMNPKTGKAFCSFCHESATTDGVECDYNQLQDILIGLPKGIELAIGCNKMTSGLRKFIFWCDMMGYIVNLTVNQGHLKQFDMIRALVDCGAIKGLGISYRNSLPFNVPQYILDYEHTVFHVICGIDSYHEVEALRNNGVNKVLILGEKNFGFNLGKVDLTTRKHREWYWWVHKLFSIFEVVSFDNLALQQLNIKRFFTDNNWGIFNQSEHSMYINAVSGVFAPSSRTKDFNIDWSEMGLKDYFKEKELKIFK